MKITEFKENRLNDYVAVVESEAENDPLVNTPFGLSTEGDFVSAWMMNLNRTGIYSCYGGRNLTGNGDMIIITVPSTPTGIHPLTPDESFGWNGKINEFTAELAVSLAFELMSGGEISGFLAEHRPSVIFTYFDSSGPGSITVTFNGRYWAITG